MLTFLFLFGLGCGSCGPTQVEILEETEPESPITWEDCSSQIGDHPCDLTLEDQNGDNWNLYENYGSIIILDFSAEWCYYCQVAASEQNSFMAEYENDNVVYITILVEDRYGNSPPEIDNIDTWVDYFGISDPVLRGDRSLLDGSAENGWPVSGWPSFFIIDSKMVLRQHISGYSGAALMSAVESLLVEEVNQ